MPVTNSSLELEMFKKQLKDKMIEVEQLKSDVKSKNENLQTMVKASEDQEQRFALEIDSLKDEIGRDNLLCTIFSFPCKSSVLFCGFTFIFGFHIRFLNRTSCLYFFS